MSALALLFWLLATPAHANLAQTSTAAPPPVLCVTALTSGTAALTSGTAAQTCQ